VRFQGCFLLINRGKGGFFDALQEQASEVAYGNMLGRLVCFYIRIWSLLDESEHDGNESDDRIAWFQQNPLKETQMNKLHLLKGLLDSDTDVINLDEVFHQTIKELFCWTESKKLLEEVECPVQRFLTCILLTNTWYSWPLIWRPEAISYKKKRKYHLLMGRTPCIHMYFP